jgi:hypothetical protein
MKCPDCGHKMVELFTSAVCDYCEGWNAGALPKHVAPESETTREIDMGAQWRFDITTDPSDPSIV